MKKFLEDDIKNAILQNVHLLTYLGDLGQAKVVWEKTIDYHKVIADCLIFTENKGIIGIEIKTESDNLKRLSHQLDSYARTCSYVFVFCHDSHLKDVLKLLEDKKYYFVGVISYEIFDKTVLAGLVREAVPSPKFSLYVCASMFWKREIYTILSTYYSQPSLLYNNTYSDNKGDYKKERERYRLPERIPGYINKSLNFKQLLTIYRETFDNRSGTKILCEIIINGLYDANKNLQIYNFGDTYIHDKTFKQGYKGRGR